MCRDPASTGNMWPGEIEGNLEQDRMEKAGYIGLLLIALMLSRCNSPSSPYPKDGQLIGIFEQHDDLFSRLLSDHENQELYSQLGVKRVMVRSLKPKTVFFEIWYQDLFGPGGCSKGYVYSETALDCVESIDDIVLVPCGPEERRLYQRLKGNWYLFYASSN
jgi:hypothetical protein